MDQNILAVNKYQLFDDYNEKEKALKVYKHQQDGKSQSEKNQGLNSYILLFNLPQKELNCLSNLDKGIKSPIYLVCMPKNFS